MYTLAVSNTDLSLFSHAIDFHAISICLLFLLLASEQFHLQIGSFELTARFVALKLIDSHKSWLACKSRRPTFLCCS